MKKIKGKPQKTAISYRKHTESIFHIRSRIIIRKKLSDHYILVCSFHIFLLLLLYFITLSHYCLTNRSKAEMCKFFFCYIRTFF